MRLSIKHPLIKRKQLVLREQQVEVLECLCEEETLHVVREIGTIRQPSIFFFLSPPLSIVTLDLIN